MATKAKRSTKAKQPKVGVVCVGGFGAHALEQLKGLFAPATTGIKHVYSAQPVIDISASRFQKVSAVGTLLALDATEWEGVYDRSTDLIWGRSLLAGTHTYADAIKAAAAATLCGKPARLGTIRERLSIVDYDHSEPALDPNYFDTAQKNGWEWTATPYKPSPSGYAWFVFLGGGHSNWILQGSRLSVRAVRASQSFDLSKRDAKAVA